MRALIFLISILCAGLSHALEREELAALVVPPYALGEPLNEDGVYELLNSGGAHAGYVFETVPLAPIPGFSGTPINIMVTLDLEGKFIDVRLLEHNEPIFVSGLGQAPFHKFFEQYGGHSIATSMVVGVPYGDSSSSGALVYLDGVTKATASVRIAHESVLAATLAVAREKMQGLASGPPAHPRKDYTETLTWNDLVEQGIARNHRITNAELQALWEGTTWEDDDPVASDEPDALYLDLWIVDLGPASVAKATLSPDSLRDLEAFMEIADFDEPILVIDAGRHGLVSPDFVRNTSPDWLSAKQDGLPVALRDSDLFVELANGLPDGEAMILRTDRRLGFDPTREWVLEVLSVREHGMFRPEVGSVTIEATYQAPERFFERPEVVKPAPPWLEALRNRQSDVIGLGTALVVIILALGIAHRQIAALRWYTPLRFSVLAAMVIFVGWWGQGQLSIVTPMAVLRTALDGGSFAFLLYDPFSLVLWGAVIASFFLWGRGLFCGWLCPFGALQEFANWLGRVLRLPKIEPRAAWDARLRSFKYVVLASLFAVTIWAPSQIDAAAEIEPFKTAITVYFAREWWYVAYAVFWLGLSMVLFKGFCRYVCPLGALMAIGGLLRRWDWIDRRVECGSPCQLCKVKCAYGAIKKTGEIRYDECFQCLDCVTIHDDKNQCVPLVLGARKNRVLKPEKSLEAA